MRQHRTDGTRLLIEVALALVLLLCLPFPALAQAERQDLSLEELLQQGLGQSPRNVEVSTASRFAQSAAQAPSVTHVLTAQDIKTYGLRSMADILRSLPGLYISEDGSFSYIGARGLSRPSDYNTRLLFLINGMRLNENVYDTVLPGAEFVVDVSLIERVEFAPGPGSALYGNNAFFGVINVITKRVDKLQGVELETQAASNHRQQLRATFGRRFDDGAELLTSLTHYAARRIDIELLGLENAPAQHAPALFKLNTDAGSKLLAHYIFGGLQLRLGAQTDSRGLPIPFGSLEAPRFEQRLDVVRSGFVAANYERALNPDWDLALSFASQSSRYLSTRPSIDRENQIHWVQLEAGGNWLNADIRFSSLSWQGHHWVFGLDVQLDQQQRIAVSELNGPLIEESTGKDRRLGLYLQDSYQLTPHTQLLLGLRRDRSVNGASVNPRLGLVWSGVPDANLKLLYGHAFRAANLFETGSNLSLDQAAPQPERIRTAELAWDQSLSSGWRYQASVFQSQIKGLISLKGDPALEQVYFANREKVTTQGLELSLERRWASGVQMKAAVSLQRSEDEAGQTLSNSPHALLKWGLSAPIWRDDLRLGWQFQGMSSRRALPLPAVAAHGLHNFNLQWRINSQAELGLRLSNAANLRYRDPTIGYQEPILQAGRVLGASLTWSLLP